MIAPALCNLADIASCIRNDFHNMHLQFKGAEFDTFHKIILKRYYEEVAEDVDSWAEAALIFDDVTLMNFNGSAHRISWHSVECSDGITRADTIFTINKLLDNYLAALTIVFIALNKETTCHKCIGIANTVQTRIEYWSKELAYFNKRRAE